MGRQRATVRPALRSLCIALRGGDLFLRFLAGGLDLLGFFQTQQKLVFRQRFGTTAKTVPLQFLDDLVETSVLNIPRQDHRLQRIRIVGKLVRRHRHDRTRPYLPLPGDNGIPSDSLRRGSAGLDGNACPPRFMDPPPVEPFKQRR